MTCTKSDKDWQAYLSGELAEREAYELEKHLSLCSQCLERYERWILFEMSDLEKVHGNAPDLSQAIMKAIEQGEKRGKSPLRSSLFRLGFHYALAAGLALLLLGSGFFSQTLSYFQMSGELIQQTENLFVQSKLKADHWFEQIMKRDTMNFINDKGADWRDEK